MGRDMTKGSISKTLILFTVPLVLSGLLQQIFSWVDAFIVGNVEGELSLAAIGSTTSVYNVFVMVITGFTSGLSVLSAQQYGTGETKRLRKMLSTFTVLLGGIFLVVSVLGVCFTPSVLLVLNTPTHVLGIAEGYLRIIFMGIPFLAVYNTYSAVLRGMGDSRAPFLSILVSSVVNVFLDILFVAVLGFGAAGAAAATVLSQAIMTVFIVLYSIKKYKNLRFCPVRDRIDLSILRHGMSFGAPPAVQAGVSSVGNMVLQRFMNGFGEQTVAAITTAYRIDSVIILPIINIGSGVATVVAQNIGTGNRERARKTLKVGTAMIAGVSLVLTLLVLLTGQYLIAMFGLSEGSVLIGNRFFHTIASCYAVYGLAMALRGYLEGTGDLLFSGIAGIASLLVRIAASYAFACVFGNMVIGYAEAFSWVFLLGVYWVRFCRKARRKG